LFNLILCTLGIKFKANLGKNEANFGSILALFFNNFGLKRLYLFMGHNFRLTFRRIFFHKISALSGCHPISGPQNCILQAHRGSSIFALNIPYIFVISIDKDFRMTLR